MNSGYKYIKGQGRYLRAGEAGLVRVNGGFIIKNLQLCITERAVVDVPNEQAAAKNRALAR